jgi:hypothetical protein
VLEGFVIQTPLSVGQTITLRGRPEAAP